MTARTPSIGAPQWYNTTALGNCNRLNETNGGGYWFDPPLCQYRCFDDNQHWTATAIAIPFGLVFVLATLRLRGADGKLENLSTGFFNWGGDTRAGRKYHALMPIPDRTLFVRVYFLLRIMLLASTMLLTPIRFKYALTNAVSMTLSSVALLTVLCWRQPRFAPFKLESSNAMYAGDSAV